MAAIAASVGVKTPVVIPPIRRTGVIRGRKAFLVVAQRTLSEKRASRWNPRTWAYQATMIIMVPAMTKPGMNPAAKSFPTEVLAMTP